MNYKHILIALLSGGLCWSCDLFDEEETTNTENPNLEYSLGWNGSDDLSTVPVSIGVNNLTGSTGGSTDVPSSIDLVSYFPPIGNQGQYGTCVAWSVAYNTKTAVEAIDYGYSAANLASTQYQLSPKDLFLNISDSYKGQNCGGTDFSSALDIVVSRGVAPLADVPYENLSNCASGLAQSSWSNFAKDHKIESYRKITVDVNTAKSYLAQNRPIIFGARLADNFMSWDSDEVITSHSSFNRVGQHAYHAMTIAGYDDSKGFNGAFKIVNSWGEYWGDKGYIWVDYNFMVSDFCFGGNMYVIKNDNNGVEPDKQNNNNNTDNTDNTDNTVTTSVDLAAWVFEDYSTFYNGQQNDYTNERKLKFNIYNVGKETAKSSDVWSTYYIYYNAYDANDYGVIFADEFNTKSSAYNYTCSNASYDKCDMNFDIPASSSFAAVFNESSSLLRTYYMPENLNGSYYLVLISDATDIYNELDETNNYYYTTSKPKTFSSGYAARKGNDSYKNSRIASIKNINTPQKLPTNAYTREEISFLLNREKANGRLDAKVKEHRQAQLAKRYNR